MPVNPEKAYKGKPCKRCGGIFRFKCNRGCIKCETRRFDRSRQRFYESRNKKTRERWANDPEYRLMKKIYTTKERAKWRLNTIAKQKQS